MLKKSILIALFASIMLPSAEAQDKRLQGIETAIDDILKAFNTAGASVTVVEKNKVVLAKGFGYKNLEKKDKATPNTLFQIGSSSKAFTTSLMGMLADEKKVELDKPVRQYWSALEFKDPALTQQVTLMDMMTHRTGLPRHDLAWYLRGNSSNRADLVKSIRYFEKSAELRTTWQYNNFMYLAQGALAEHLTGKPWETLVKERIFKPLSMNQSVLSTADMLDSPDFAQGYGYDEKKKTNKLLDHYHFSGMEPAGSIASNANDMGKWLQLWIYGGQYQGKEVFSKQFYQQATVMHMVMPASSKPEVGLYLHGYGLGWMIRAFKGHYFVEHGGNIDGFSTTVGFFPHDSIGIYVSVNQNGSAAQSAIRNWIADRMLGTDKTDWVAHFKPKSDDSEKPEEVADLAQIKGTQPSHPLDQYVGDYWNDGYGQFKVFAQNNLLFALMGKDTARLEHYHYDVFQLKSTTLEDAGETGMKLRFNTGYDGEIQSLGSLLEPALSGDIEFKKKAKVMDTTASSLKQYTGNYSLQGATVKMEERGGVLYMNVPGQPEYELVPSKEHEFKLKIAEGYAVRFELKDGKVVAAYSIQPNGTFKMVRA